MSNKAIVILSAVVLLLFIAFISLFTVQEGERALTLRLGELTTNPQGQIKIFAPGLHFKTPFITKVRWFDVRLQTLNVDSSRILTAEQKYVRVDYYAKWRIDDLALYYKRTGGNPARAQRLLTQKINDSLRAAIGERTIKEVISGERADIMKLLKAQANKSAQGLGIRVTDVRIQAIDLPSQVRDSVYQRMRSEREQVATKHRAQGQAEAEAIRADADKNAAITIAEAKTKAQRIRAAGDAEAANIYIKAYSQDPEFYAFYRSLEAYRQVFRNKDTIMVLRPDNKFFKYFNEGKHHITPHKKSPGAA